MNISIKNSQREVKQWQSQLYVTIIWVWRYYIIKYYFEYIGMAGGWLPGSNVFKKIV